MVGKFLLLMAVWIGLTNSLDPQELVVGAAVVFGIVVFFTPREQNVAWGATALKYLRFTPVFFKELIRSNIEVARIVLTPGLPVNPGIVALRTSLREDHDKLLLANAITLTPGTLTLELRGDTLFIHVLVLKDEHTEALQARIIAPFEDVLNADGPGWKIDGESK